MRPRRTRGPQNETQRTLAAQIDLFSGGAAIDDEDPQPELFAALETAARKQEQWTASVARIAKRGNREYRAFLTSCDAAARFLDALDEKSA